MMTCNRCRSEKPDEDYYFKDKPAGKRQKICKACWHPYFVHYFRGRRADYAAHRRRNKALYAARNREFIARFLETHPCIDCGIANPIVLQFDHVRGEKCANITDLVQAGRSFEILVSEVEKCVVRCANCHCRRTALAGKNWRSVRLRFSPLVEERRICTKCKQVKLPEDFFWKYKKSGKRRTMCKHCCRPYGMAHYRRNREAYNQKRRDRVQRYERRNQDFVAGYFLTHPCVDCGNDDLVVLQFDHVFDEKEYDVSTLLRHATSLATLKGEIAKCEVRCANCHQIRTSATSGFWKERSKQH